MERLRLALLGDGIGRSSAPRLHRAAGGLASIEVTYDLLDLSEADPAGFEGFLETRAQAGYAGVNVTHPYKERAARVVRIEAERVRRIGAVNTVRFGPGGERAGFNTDHSGFLRAFRARFGDARPGAVAVVGAGGVGRPVAFGLATLGASALAIHDADAARAERLAADVGDADPRVAVRACPSVEAATDGADGVVNCTPLGMYQHPGSAVPRALLAGRRWAFDVVYTPLETQFLRDAQAAGLDLLSGWELFFYQGIDAFEIFSGVRVEEAALRAALASE